MRNIGEKDLKKQAKWLKWIYDWSDLIEREGEISEVDILMKSGSSPWTFHKLRPYLLKLKPSIKYNEKLGLYYFVRLENSLSTLSTEDKEEMK